MIALFVLLLLIAIVASSDWITGLVYFINTIYAILSKLVIFPLLIVSNLSTLFTGVLTSLVDIVEDTYEVVFIGLFTVNDALNHLSQSEYSATYGIFLAQIWLMFIPFPVVIWVLREKNRSWLWSIFTLWTLSWIPLTLKNKRGEIVPDKYIEIAGIKVLNEDSDKGITESDSGQSQTSAVRHSDGCSGTRIHLNKTGDTSD